MNANPAMRRRVSLDEALRRIGDQPDIHTFRSTQPNILTGCDWDRDELIAYITAHGVEDSGPEATAMGHTLVANADAHPLFIEAAPPDTP